MPTIATLATVRRLAQRLPDVAEGTSYGTPAWRVRGKFFARMREDGETLVVKVEPEEKPLLMASEPEIFYETDHYKGYALVLVRLPAIAEDELCAAAVVGRAGEVDVPSWIGVVLRHQGRTAASFPPLPSSSDPTRRPRAPRTERSACYALPMITPTRATVTPPRVTWISERDRDTLMKRRRTQAIATSSNATTT